MAEAFDAAEALENILADHGPLHEDELVRRMRDAGMPEPQFSFERYVEDIGCPAQQLVDNRWVWLPTLLAGRIFTHRLDADEVAHDILAVSPNLNAVTELCEYEQYRHFADGSAAQVAMSEFDDDLLEQRGIPEQAVDPLGALVLAPGTLTRLGVAPGDVVGVRLTPQGLDVEKVTPADHPTVGSLLSATLDPDEPTYFDAAVWTVCAEDPTVFTEPLLPLSEIVDDFGLQQQGEWLAPGEFDFDTWDFERGCKRLARRHGLDSDDAFALYTLIKLFDQVSALVELADASQESAADAPEPDGGVPVEGSAELVEIIGDVGAALADPMLAQLLVTETIGAGRHGAALGLFADTLEPKVPRAARAACRWLRAVALERLGDIDEWERELLAAESMDPSWPLPLCDLARLASDRGDAERGLSLLRRADATPDNPLVLLLERHRATARADIGRNALCWCGSGRKYKKCHLGREQLPLSGRAGWLYAKATQHVHLSGWDDELAMAAYERVRYADDRFEAMRSALDDPLVTDAVLFEGGGFDEFVRMRGHLLPEDERLLAEQWLLVDRSVFEVEQVRHGQGVTVRDVRTGDTHEVQERTASRQLRPGQLVCARVVPAGDTKQFFGGVEPIALHERDALIDLLDEGVDPSTLIAQLSRRFAPPALVNTEGEPLTLCESTVQLSDPAAVVAALDDNYERIDGEESLQWCEFVGAGEMRHVRAVLVLDGDSLRVQTNSDVRMDRVLATLANLDPAMCVLDASRHPLRDARAAAEFAKQMPGASERELDPDDPEVAAMLDEYIRSYEAKWLDEPIPALDGDTPRQAADDPTRRGDLVKLLDSFPASAGRAAMNADRLRTTLGLR